MKLARSIALAATFLYVPLAKADLADKLSKLTGYIIVDTKTVTARYDDGKRTEGFEGCQFGRVIVFQDNKTLTCAQYGYQYAYRPDAVILAKPMTFQSATTYDYKMIVGDEVYDMRR